MAEKVAVYVILIYLIKTAKTGNPWLTKVRYTGNLFKGSRYFVHGYVCCVVGYIEASQIDNQKITMTDFKIREPVSLKSERMLVP